MNRLEPASPFDVNNCVQEEFFTWILIVHNTSTKHTPHFLSLGFEY